MTSPPPLQRGERIPPKDLGNEPPSPLDDGSEASAKTASLSPEPVKIVSERRPIVSLRPSIWDGSIDIMLDDFAYVTVNYDYRYTDNASRHALAEKIARLIATGNVS